MSAPLQHPVTAAPVPIRDGPRIDHTIILLSGAWQTSIHRLPDVTPLRYYCSRDGVTAASILEVMILPGGFEAFGLNAPVPNDAWREGLRLAADLLIPFIVVAEADGILFRAVIEPGCRFPQGLWGTNVPLYAFTTLAPRPRLPPRAQAAPRGRR